MNNIYYYCHYYLLLLVQQQQHTTTSTCPIPLYHLHTTVVMPKRGCVAEAKKQRKKKKGTDKPHTHTKRHLTHIQKMRAASFVILSISSLSLWLSSTLSLSLSDCHSLSLPILWISFSLSSTLSSTLFLFRLTYIFPIACGCWVHSFCWFISLF